MIHTYVLSGLGKDYKSLKQLGYYKKEAFGKILLK
jgi:hypothetical protein